MRFRARLSVPGDPQALAAARDGAVTAVVWDFQQPRQKISNRSFYTKIVPVFLAASVKLEVVHLMSRGSYAVEVHRVGFHANDAYSAYLETGAPKDLTATQVAHLMDLTRDVVETHRRVRRSYLTWASAGFGGP